MTSMTREQLRRRSSKTLVRWLYVLNRWGWPAQFPTPNRKMSQTRRVGIN
jgi:hypothetical protein